MNTTFKLLLLSSLIFAASIKAEEVTMPPHFISHISLEEYQEAQFLEEHRDKYIDIFIRIEEAIKDLYLQNERFTYSGCEGQIITTLLEGCLAEFRRNACVDFLNYEASYLDTGKKRIKVSDAVYDFLHDNIIANKNNKISWSPLFHKLKSSGAEEKDFYKLFFSLCRFGERLGELSKLLPKANS